MNIFNEILFAGGFFTTPTQTNLSIFAYLHGAFYDRSENDLFPLSFYSNILFICIIVEVLSLRSSQAVRCVLIFISVVSKLYKSIVSFATC